MSTTWLQCAFTRLRGFFIKTTSSAIFDTPSKQRERRVIWRFFETAEQFDLVSGRPIFWSAVNIPLNLIGAKINGDIDLIFKLYGETPQSPPLYRAFEIKVSVFSKKGLGRSLKQSGGKIAQVVGQIKKLENFGCRNLFLLDTFLFQGGFSTVGKRLPQTQDTILGKFSKTAMEINSKTNAGYIFKAFEPLPKRHEDAGGIWWPTRTIITSKFKSVKPQGDFANLVKYLDNKYTRISGGVSSAFDVMTYCPHCKKIVIVKIKSAVRNFLNCPNCKRSLLD